MKIECNTALSFMPVKDFTANGNEVKEIKLKVLTTGKNVKAK